MAYEFIMNKKAQNPIYLHSHMQQEAMEAS
jgi:hypothetical protein